MKMADLGVWKTFSIFLHPEVSPISSSPPCHSSFPGNVKSQFKFTFSSLLQTLMVFYFIKSHSVLIESIDHGLAIIHLHVEFVSLLFQILFNIPHV